MGLYGPLRRLKVLGIWEERKKGFGDRGRREGFVLTGGYAPSLPWTSWL
jgi:hypothetical protein